MSAMSCRTGYRPLLKRVRQYCLPVAALVFFLLIPASAEDIKDAVLQSKAGAITLKLIISKGPDACLSGIEVRDAKDTLLQVIEHVLSRPDDQPDWHFNHAVSLVDMDLDGHDDLKLANERPSPNQDFRSFLWDPKQKQFVENEELEEANVIDVHSNGTLTGTIHQHRGRATTIYRWSKDHHLETVEIERFSMNRNGGPHYSKTIYRDPDIKIDYDCDSDIELEDWKKGVWFHVNTLKDGVPFSSERKLLHSLP